MSNVTSINSKREPVLYSIHISSGFDGVIEATVEGIDQDEKSRRWIVNDLKYLITLIDPDTEKKDEQD
jgi:hypothetical protein